MVCNHSIMKLVIYGETDRYGTGAWCYKQAIARSNCSIVEYDNTLGLNNFFNRFWWRFYRRLGGVIPNYLRQRHIRPFLELCQRNKADIIIILKGLYFSADDVKIAKASGAWIININHDDFFSKNRNNWSSMQRDALGSYDYIFTTRAINVGEVAPFNHNVEFFPFAYEPTIHRIVCSENELDSGADVLFVGTHERERAALLEKLANTLPVNLEIFGEGWTRLDSNSCLRSKVKGPGLWGDDMARALGSAKVSLGFLRKENRDEYTQRSFEIPACGGVFLAERTPSHQRFFTEGIEAEFFDSNSSTELIFKVKALLSDKERRKSMRDAGHAAVMRQKHTYDDRINRLFELHKQRQTAKLHAVSDRDVCGA